MELLVTMLNKKFPNMTDHHNYYSPQEFYDNNFVSDSIKLESNQSHLLADMDSLSNNPMLTTASVPIPQRGTANNRILTDLSEYVFDLETSQSPQLVQDISYTNNTSGGTMFELQSPDTVLSSTWPEFGGIQNTSIATKQEFLMEEEDIFQVDKADLIQGPTLAELNGDNLYVDLLNIDEIITAEQLSSQFTTLEPHFNNSAIQSSSNVPIQIFSQHTPQTPNNSLQSNVSFYDDQTPTTSSSSYGTVKYQPTNASINNNSRSHASPSPLTVKSSVTPPPSYYAPANPGNVGIVQHNPKFTQLQELLLKKNDALQYRRERHFGQSVPGNSGGGVGGGNNSNYAPRPEISPGRKLLNNLHPSTSSRLSSSAPTRLGLDQLWQRREPRAHLLSTGSLVEAGSTSSLSTGGVLSPEAPDFSQDEGFSDDDSDDHDDDYSSDNDSDNENPSHSAGANNNNSKSKRYFWQYNVQAKGPKGQRLVIKTQQEDPHVLNEVTDPVFSPNCSVRGIKHSGKARKGDGNDLTPNAKKLHNIGKELDKLGRVINDMTPVSELPFNVRPKTRKEKNKLASRACRLKKKAQHEANKIKLDGLEQEHKRLLHGIHQMKQILVMKWGKPVTENTEEFNQHIEKLLKQATKVKIAGNTTEYVNAVLEKYKNGSSAAPLEEGFQHYYT